MTRQQAREYVQRWKAANAYEIAELRRTPVEVKMRQTAALMSSVKLFG